MSGLAAKWERFDRLRAERAELTKQIEALADELRGEIRKQATNLTRREGEVLRLIRAGKQNKEIADALCIATRTVKYHVGQLMAKAGAQSRHEL